MVSQMSRVVGMEQLAPLVRVRFRRRRTFPVSELRREAAVLKYDLTFGDVIDVDDGGRVLQYAPGIGVIKGKQCPDQGCAGRRAVRFAHARSTRCARRLSRRA